MIIVSFINILYTNYAPPPQPLSVRPRPPPPFLHHFSCIISNQITIFYQQSSNFLRLSKAWLSINKFHHEVRYKILQFKILSSNQINIGSQKKCVIYVNTYFENPRCYTFFPRFNINSLQWKSRNFMKRQPFEL